MHSTNSLTEATRQYLEASLNPLWFCIEIKNFLSRIQIAILEKQQSELGVKGLLKSITTVDFKNRT